MDIKRCLEASSKLALALTLGLFTASQCNAAMLTELTFFGDQFGTSSYTRPHRTLISLAGLAKYKVVMLIDKSRSMGKIDCPNSSGASSTSLESRWQWCREQTTDLSMRTKKVLPEGMNVVVFSDKAQTYTNVDATQVQKIFSDTTPDGATLAGAALQPELASYFSSQESEKEKKPLLLVMITDGCPNKPFQFKHAIIEATKKLKNPDEVSLVVLQIGNDEKGQVFLDHLDNDLVAQNAKFDIVKVIHFDQLKKLGLPTALAEMVCPITTTASATK